VLKGKAFIETGAIVELLTSLAEERLVPHRRDDRILYRQFLHYAEGSLMGPLLTTWAMPARASRSGAAEAGAPILIVRSAIPIAGSSVT
jgi:hypothetical protein